jgi:hypothetical protein
MKNWGLFRVQFDIKSRSAHDVECTGFKECFTLKPLGHGISFFSITYLSVMMIRQSSRIRCQRILSATSHKKRYVHIPAKFNWEDPLDAASLFTPEELSIQETAQAYSQERLLPRVLGRQTRRVRTMNNARLRY